MSDTKDTPPPTFGAALRHDTIRSICIGGVQYDADADGVIEVEATHLDEALAIGLTRVPPAAPVKAKATK